MNDAMILENRDATSMYEGKEPYVFISYSHRDTASMIEVCTVLGQKNVRFWYDSGLRSGDDWNLVIAVHLEKAAVCLLLLSRASASSQYVKNELNFALNHRIPIHIVALEDFELPIDVEMMVGRIQIVEKSRGYEERLLEALPGEVYDASFEQQESNRKGIYHPLFQTGAELANRQGTISYLGTHRTLDYEILMQEDYNLNVSMDAALRQAKIAAKLSHPLFPKIYDIVIENSRMYTFQEYRGEMFLDQYLRDHKIQEAEIVEWITSVVDAMDYLFSLNIGFRDFARGSLVVTKNKKIGILRLQNIHYGVVKLQPENKQFYFEKEVEEIAVLLYQLCTGTIPVLPFSMISSESLSKSFIDKVNLIIQKSTKENHKIKYNTFREIVADLKLHRIGISDILFLKRRQAKLKEYENIKKANLDGVFTSNEKANVCEESLEEKFGFDATVTLFEASPSDTPIIRVKICSTGQLLEFAKNEIIIGRSSECDMTLNQPSVSRLHVRIYKENDDNYMIEDLNSSNGTFWGSVNERMLPGQKLIVQKNEIIQVADIRLQLC